MGKVGKVKSDIKPAVRDYLGKVTLQKGTETHCAR